MEARLISFGCRIEASHLGRVTRASRASWEKMLVSAGWKSAMARTCSFNAVDAKRDGAVVQLFACWATHLRGSSTVVASGQQRVTHSGGRLYTAMCSQSVSRARCGWRPAAVRTTERRTKWPRRGGQETAADLGLAQNAFCHVSGLFGLACLCLCWWYWTLCVSCRRPDT